MTTLAPPFDPSLLPSKLECGAPFVKPNEIGLRIVGGIESFAHSWPWSVNFQKLF